MKRTGFHLYIPYPDFQFRMRSLTRWLPTPGNVVFTVLLVGGLLWAQNVGAFTLGAPLAAATSTGTIAYQGRLADVGGNPLTDTYNMVFRLYTGASGGAPLWEEQWTGSNSVAVSDGLFNVMLGSLTPIPQTVITGNSNLFLGISVGTDNEMSPRIQLGSIPYAVQALTVPDGSISAAKLAPDVNLVPPDGSIGEQKLANGAVTSVKLADKAVTRTKTTILTNRSGYVDIPQGSNHTFVFTHNLGHTNYTAICTAEDNGSRGRHLKGAMQANTATDIRFAVNNAGDDGTQTVQAHCLIIPD